MKRKTDNPYGWVMGFLFILWILYHIVSPSDHTISEDERARRLEQHQEQIRLHLQQEAELNRMHDERQRQYYNQPRETRSPLSRARKSDTPLQEATHTDVVQTQQPQPLAETSEPELPVEPEAGLAAEPEPSWSPSQSRPLAECGVITLESLR